MEHVVFFPAADGQPLFRRLGSREDALRFVEHLRNVEGVTEVSVHELAEVPLSFKPWYRVEVPAGEAAGEAAEALLPAAPDPVTPDPQVAEPIGLVADEPLADELVPAARAVPVVEEEPSLNGHSEARGLGFFAS